MSEGKIWRGLLTVLKNRQNTTRKRKEKLGRMRRQLFQSWDWFNATFTVLWKTVFRLCLQCLNYVFSRKLKLPVAESLASFFCSSDKYFYSWNNHDAL